MQAACYTETVEMCALVTLPTIFSMRSLAVLQIIELMGMIQSTSIYKQRHMNYGARPGGCCGTSWEMRPSVHLQL